MKKSEQFIEESNQTMLWEVMQNCQHIRLMDRPEGWFAEMIGKFYEQLLLKETEKGFETMFTLKQINQEALLYMLIDLKKLVEYVKQLREKSLSNSVQNTLQVNPMQQNTLQDKNTKHETHEVIHLDAFAPADIDMFAHQQQAVGNWIEQDVILKQQVTADTPIKNMEELLEQQMRQRDHEMPIMTAPIGEKV